MQVIMTVNGTEVTRDVEPRLLLVHFLRDTLGLTGTHWGCDTSNCGTCVVLLDGEPVVPREVVRAEDLIHFRRAVHDVYVDRDLSLQTAGRVRGLQVWETDAFHHDGIGDDGPAILRRLLEMTG